MSLGAELEHLYGLPLGEFTAVRDALAKRLRADGDREAAAEVKALRKPSVALWALNQLPRQHPEPTEALLEASRRLRSAQRRAVSGGRKDALREAQAERRRAVARLRELAGEVLRDAGHGASPDTLARISRSLEAVAADEAGAEALSRGCLRTELEPAGFVDVGALEVLEAEPESSEREEPPPEKPPPDEDPARVEAERAAADARRRAEEASRAAVRAEEAAMKRGEAVEARERKVEKLRSDVEAAERRLEELRAAVETEEGKLEEVRSSAEAADTEARELRERAETAARELREAESALRDLDG